MASRNRIIVAAIDFGTTFSGYAFSLRHDYQKDPTKCITAVWNNGVSKYQSLKTSTCILFNEQREFHSFGFEAEEQYSELALDNEHQKWFLFKRFKMLLYKKEGIKRNCKLKAENGQQMVAMEVFSATIRYLKDHLVRKYKQQQARVVEEDILFVLTVPSIWNDQAKQFMREAAEKAGIKKENLLIALEPEAASLFCKNVPVEKMVNSSGKGHDAFKPGSKYIVLDAGGGTIDITVHEVKYNGHLKEIHRANGGDWGGTRVDKAFRSLLEDIVGEQVLQSFSEEFKYDMLDLFTDFEVKKRSITPDLSGKITFRVPINLSETFKKLSKGKEIKDVLKTNKKYAGKLSWAGDKLRMDADIAIDLYKETTDQIVHHMQELSQKHAVKDAQYILMVGGFSESPMLHDAIQKAFPQKRVIIPNEAGLSVLKGAVIFGYDPQIIDIRVCKKTYGVGSSMDFDSAIHEESQKFTTSDGRVKCNNLFSKHVEIEQEMKVGCPQSEIRYQALESSQTKITFPVFISTEEDPKYTTDPSCTRLGSIKIQFPGEGLDRYVTICMTYSGTELEVKAIDEQTGERSSAFFDVLK